MTEFKKILMDISDNLKEVKYDNGDLSDIGNEIGIIIAKYIEDKPGFEMIDFIAGLKHGISLVDGTHNKIF